MRAPDDRQDEADPFALSALANDSEIMPLHDFHAWLGAQRAAMTLEVRRVPLAAMDAWEATAAPHSLMHRSGKFFSVEGLRARTDFGPTPVWDQPIIRQDEVGILGILVRRIDGAYHFLMQAKVEPGNINGVQLAPTVQSTRSNYTQVHGGRQAPYTAYFLGQANGRVLIDRLLTEQGARFLNKCNRNMIVEVGADVEVEDGFCWLTLGQIGQLLREDNLVSMSSRSILSCIPFNANASSLYPLGQGGRSTLHREDESLNWLNSLRARYTLRREQRPLNQLDGWIVDDDAIRHESGRHFAVIGVEVTATAREVLHWNQPILAHSGDGINGFLLQRRNGVPHLLVRACMFPGNGLLFELGSTVSRSNGWAHLGLASQPPFLEYFFNPPAARIRYQGRHSEEGGRFYHYVSQYMIVEIPEEQDFALPENFQWMSIDQFRQFNHYGYVNIEGRNMLTCLSLTQNLII